MAIEFKCPACGEFYRLKDEFAGKKTKCRVATCSAVLTVPAKSTLSPPPPPPAVAVPPPPAVVAACPPATAARATATIAPPVVKAPPPPPPVVVPPPIAVPPVVAKAPPPPVAKAPPPPPVAKPTFGAAKPAARNFSSPDSAALAALRDDAPAIGPDTVSNLVPQTKTDPDIDFKCEYCSGDIQAPFAKAGKKMPCPHEDCGMLVTVPVPKTNKPKDWRDSSDGKPQFAKREEQKLSGAWDAGRTYATRQALDEAGVGDEEPDPPTWGWRLVQLTAVAVIVAGVFFAGSRVSISRTQAAQGRVLDEVLRVVQDKDAGLSPGQMALMNWAIGIYATREGQEKNAGRDRLTAAYTILRSQLPSSNDRDAALMEVILAQADLGSEDAELLETKKRVPWRDAPPGIDSVEIILGRSLQQLSPEALPLALRRLAARLAPHGGAAAEAGLAAARRAIVTGDATEAVALMATELASAGHKARMEQEADKLKALAAENKVQLTPFVTALVLTLASAETPPTGLPPPTTVPYRLAYVEGWARQGKWDDARKTAASLQKDDRCRGFLLLAHLPNNAEASKDLDEAAKAKSNTTPAWVLWQGTELARRHNLPEVGKTFAESITDPAFRPWAQLQLFDLRLTTVDKNTLGNLDWLSDVPLDAKNPSLGAQLAVLRLARHNTANKLDTTPLDTVKAWDEKRRPLGLAGVALGTQDNAVSKP